MEFMSNRFPIQAFVKRNRPSQTQAIIFITAAALSSTFIAVSSALGAKAEADTPMLSAATQVVEVVNSPAAKSTLAPLEDSIETIAKVAKIPAAAEKSQELVEMSKGPKILESQAPDVQDLVTTVPVPAELQAMPEQRTAELATVPVILQPAAPVGMAAPVSMAGSAYPYATVPFPNSMPDEWGMYKRQCVSYAAWKVASSGRNMPFWGGRGNASQWDDNARAAGIPVDSVPRVGDIAVSHDGGYGHVSYVEAVYPDGTILVSQYNARWDGRYSEERLSTAGLVFIHF